MKLFNNTIDLPDTVAVSREDTLDENTGVHRVALSTMWYDDEATKKAIQFIEQQVTTRARKNWLRAISFVVKGHETITYTMVNVTITHKYGHVFLEFESLID